MPTKGSLYKHNK